jgi:GrpB-like predicted nucleotidyltransferase (UPF0157 family)
MSHQTSKYAVVLAPSDPAWPALFEEEKRRVLSVAAEAITEVHHVGSTSIPGIMAKPVIDVLLVLNRFLSDAEIVAVARPGYEYRGEQGMLGRQYFSRRTAPAFHLHAFLETHPDVRQMLLFRDYLREHPEAAREYEALKLRLARDQDLEPIAYTDGKTAFVQRIDALARAWAG